MRHLLLLPPPPPSTCCGPRFGRFVKRIFRALRRGARCAHRFGRTPRVTPSVRVPRPLRSPLDQRTSSRGVALESLASHVCALSQAVVSVIARARKAAFFSPLLHWPRLHPHTNARDALWAGVPRQGRVRLHPHAAAVTAPTGTAPCASLLPFLCWRL